jgi:transposase
MANRLEMVKIKAILTLHQQGWSCRRIGRKLGIRHETASKYIQAAGASKPATAPSGSDDPKAAKAPPGSEPDPPDSEAGSQSDCEPFREQILALLDLGLSAKRIWQDLSREDEEFQASYWSVRRFVRSLRATHPLPFRRLECEPGEEAQVDFGTGAPVRQEDGRKRRPYVFRIVLSHSRKGYSEVVYRQTTENFIRCLENAFWHFGGVPKVLVIDNLRAAVKKADWFDPELNPKLESFCEHYGVVILPTRPYTPRHKGKVERGVDYVQENGLKGRIFDSLDEENRHLVDWETSVADTRIHGTTRQQVGRVFQEVERATLKPLPLERFPFFHEGGRTVHRDGHVEVDKSYYSVPPEYVGRRVWVRWDSRLVRIFSQRMEQITIHAKQEPGRFSTQSKHIALEKISGVERGMTWWLKKASHIGPETAGWATAMVEARGIQALRPLMGLVQLAAKHRPSVIERACETARSYGAYQLRTVRQLIRREADKQQQFEFIQEHPMIRSLEDYGQIVRDSLRQEEGNEDRWQEAAGS